MHDIEDVVSNYGVYAVLNYIVKNYEEYFYDFIDTLDDHDYIGYFK